MTTFRTLALASLGLLAAVTADVSAAPRQVLAGVIRNDTSFPVTYQYKFGNGGWITMTLRPKHSYQYSLPYPPRPGTSTDIQLRWVDSTTKVRRVTYGANNLAMWVTDSPAKGWLHRFIVVNDGTKIVLAR